MTTEKKKKNDSSMPYWESLKYNPQIAHLYDMHLKTIQLAKEAKFNLNEYEILADTDCIQRIINRLSSTLTMMIIGDVSSGKSSFANSLLGRKLFITSDSPTDGVISVMMHSGDGNAERAERVIAKDGQIISFASLEKACSFIKQEKDSGKRKEQLNCREVRLFIDNPFLKNFRVINTPGLGDPVKPYEDTTLNYLKNEESDVIVWTFYPETAANEFEIKTFASVLSLRRSSVIGIITRSLEGHEDDLNYDPHEAYKEVVEKIEEEVGEYLSHIIVYDSPCALDVAKRLKEDPGLANEKNFVQRMKQCGYSELSKIIEDMVGQNGEKIESTRVKKVLLRCSSASFELAKVADSIEMYFQRQSGMAKETIEALRNIEKLIMDHTKPMKDDIKKEAEDSAKELVNIIGQAASDAIIHDFKMLGTLGRSILGWTGMVKKPSDHLNEKIEEAVKAAIEKSNFDERLNKKAKILIDQHFITLKKKLEVEDHTKNLIDKVKIDTGKPGGSAGEVINDVFIEAVKGVMSQVLKQLSETMAKKAGGKIAEKGAEKVSTIVAQTASQAALNTAAATTEQITAKAGAEAAQQGIKTGARGIGSTAARAASIILLILIPFDIAKMRKDFKESKTALSDYVLKRYQGDWPRYERQIYDSMWELAWNRIKQVLSNVEEKMSGDNQWDELIVEAGNLKRELSELKNTFTRMVEK